MGSDNSRRALTIAALFLLGGCAPESDELLEPGATSPERDQEADERTLSGEDLAEGVRNGDWIVLPPTDAPDDTARVGLLVALNVEGPLPPVEMRLLVDGLPITDWVPFATTWSESEYHVAIAEFGAVGRAVQLRVGLASLASFRMLRWTPGPAVPPPDASDDDSSGVGTTTSALRTDLIGLGIVTREAWGARSSTCVANASKNRITIHHTETPSENPERQVRAIQNYHKDTRGWCDIGYHFLIAVDGTIYEGCPLDRRGTHTANQNTGNIGISFIGCFHPGCRWAPTTPPEAAIQAAGRLVGALSRIYGFPLNAATVKAHRDQPGASTDCPGDFLYARIPDIISIGNSGSTPPPDTGPTEPPPAPDPGVCGTLACDACGTTAGCGWCAARGACAATSSSCTWAGRVGDQACWSALWPCAVATCWNPTVTAPACGSATWDENFSSGRYGVHRYWLTLPTGGPVTLRLARTGGSFAPALLVSDRTGRLVYGGETASLHPDVVVRNATSGRTGTFAEVTLEASRNVDVYVYVTGWAVLDGAFRGTLSTTSKYRLSATQSCAPPPPPAGTPPSPLDRVWAGLTQAGSEIPRSGLYNPTMGFLGTTTEPYGTLTTDTSGRAWVRGTVSWFGGPRDTGVSSTETGAISGDVLRSLNNPVSPDAATLASRPADYYFVAMRWSYSPNGQAFWRDARILVRNPATGVAVVARPVDWGPNTSTHRIIDLSPQTLADLGLDTDGQADVAFASPGSALGVVR
jgi:hypothetical protein